MRLRAIELEEVGTFTTPVQIRDIGPGLNVLAGANELGKSTILRALTALFTEQHRTVKQSVRDLRPYVGGAPLIRCTFDLGGHGWLLEKRYLSAQRALIKRLDGAEQHQGADAENRLAELIWGERGMGQSLPLLWVEQGDGFEVPVLDERARQSFADVLAAQAEMTSGAKRAQAVLKAVEDTLGQLVTKKTGKPRKDYSKLMAEQGEVRVLLSAAREKAQAAEQRVAQLNELQREALQLSDREAMTALTAHIAEHEKRLQAAHEAERQLQQLAERVVFLESQMEQRAAMLAAHDEGVRALEGLTASVAAADAELSQINDRSAVLGCEIEAASETAAGLKQREYHLDQRLSELRLADEDENRRAQLTQLASRQQRLSEIAGEIALVDTELGGLVWPETAIGDMRRAAARRDQLEMRQAAGAPRLRFRYEAGRSSGFRIDGAAVGDDADVLASSAMTITVEGIGQIDVVPGDGDGREALAQDLAEAEAALQGCLAMIGARDPAEAEARAGRRGALSHARQLHLSERDGLAPGGVELIEADVARLLAAEVSREAHNNADADRDERRAQDDTPLPQTVALVQSELETIRAEHSRLSGVVDALKSERLQIDHRRAEIAAELRVRRARGDELRAKYVSGEGMADPRDALAEKAEAARGQLNDAVRNRLAVQAAAVTQAAIGELEQALAGLKARAAERTERLQTVRQEVRHVEGILARDFEDGAAEEVEELEGRLDELAARLEERARHVAALRLLSDELGSELALRRDLIGLPLARRLTGMAGRVWPGAEFAINSDLGVDGLMRSGARETPVQVSAGTREQIAVLARLAFAGMMAEGLAEHSGAVPVILDDPLVFSDDQRLDALFNVIAEAAMLHQVIVLTCHERAFEPLISRHGATRLVLT